ncbi:MAG TPA: MBL fold metallo-hydrolase [Pseudomonadales bacterium]|nr:MBL fold metallo-hydrolase [Pseudomonadales bacterium]
MRVVIGVMVLVTVIGAVVLIALRIPAVQDSVLERGLDAAMRAPAEAPPEGGLRVIMCGTSSPLPAPDRAQACVAVQAGDRLYLVDAGAGSPNVATAAGLPLEDLRAILLTHFHSDHIAAIGDFNLMSWVAGRLAPLEVAGPEGVERVVAGFNEVYALDRTYRVAHHGADLLPPELHVLAARTIAPGVILDEDGLTITAFTVDHSPVSPTVGYRFDRGGRSVVIAGDTLATQGLREAARDADLLLADALSLPIVQAMERAATAAGQTRRAKIFADIQDYHADTGSLATLAEAAGVGRLALYHLVPAPRNAIMKNVFRRGLPDSVILTEDGMTFDLPADSETLRVHE